ncbi:GNAT family N-acetyltransferase [Planococcus ruber]|nr:GNAT family N-acetyltransferase [Planococcus ruber]MCJ1909742.1 GNAT family N-acetyltransferase [Planococcus ruber]
MVDLFYETVHSVNAAHYTAEQLHAWAPMDEKEERIKKWRVSLAQNFSFVAEQKGKVVGFSDLQQDGYLNRLYVHKDHQRQGVAAALLNVAEKEAGKLGLSEITLDASLTAKPFFEKRGYETIRQQTVVRKGIALTNFKMRKTMD